MAGCENDYAAPTTIPPYGNCAMKKSGKFSSLQKEDFSRRRGGLDKFDLSWSRCAMGWSTEERVSD